LSAEFGIGETELAAKSLGAKHKRLARKLAEYVYPQLRRKPHYGPNIKKLKGELAEFWRYRVGKFRVFYTVDDEEKLVMVHEIEFRKDAYMKTSEKFHR